MSLRVNCKLGTVPWGIVEIKSKRKLPAVGDCCFIRRIPELHHGEKWQSVRVTKINDYIGQPYYFFDKE